jgi:hypothetical protein
MSEELELEGKFKTADELGLSEKQYCGLVQTLAWLEAGKLDHENEKTRGFDMEMWGGKCGSVCCIGGTAEVLGGLDRASLNQRAFNGSELGALFYPGGKMLGGAYNERHPGWRASTAQAAVALRGYLETGRTDWDAAMKTPRERRK